MDTLNVIGPRRFIEYACEQAYTLAGRYYRPNPNRELDSTKILSVQEFIHCVDKYTERWKHPVRLDAEIVENEAKTGHRLVVHGIRDHGIRERKNPHYFRGHQEGIWDCVLEEALVNGLAPEEIEVFRQTLNLLPKYGIFDKGFFQRRARLTI